MFDLDGKVALVTTANRPQGTGTGIALELARAGADVAVNGRYHPLEELPAPPLLMQPLEEVPPLLLVPPPMQVQVTAFQEPPLLMQFWRCVWLHPPEELLVLVVPLVPLLPRLLVVPVVPPNEV